MWHPEDSRVQSVVLKLARCHAAYELNQPQLHEPEHIRVFPLPTLNPVELQHFETSAYPDICGWPEVGSRSFQRISFDEVGIEVGGWLVVQEGRYRFLAAETGSVIIRGVLSEYLGYEVIWD